MNDKEVLEKAIQKAIDGGWKYFYGEHGGIGWSGIDAVLNYYHFDDSDCEDDKYDEDNWKLFIFDHHFAKALWGNDEWGDCKVCKRAHYDISDMNDNVQPDLHHLQEMVISEDPIKYLGQNT